MADYTLIRQLGKGATSDVFLGLNSQDQYVVIKIMNVVSSKRETTITKYLNRLYPSDPISPVILKVIYPDNDRCIVISEYLSEFLSLEDILLSPECFSLEKTIIAKNLILAIEKLHRANICHRDIKPANILSDKNSIRIIDFDASCVKHHFTCIKNAGTPYYISPEQRAAKEHNYVFDPSFNDFIKMDIYSLGVTLFDILLCATIPFITDDEFELGTALYRGENLNNYLEKVNDKLLYLPTSWQQIVRGCIEINPDNRWSMNQIISALE